MAGRVIAAGMERCVSIVAAAVDGVTESAATVAIVDGATEWVAVARVAGCDVKAPGFEAVAAHATDVVAVVR
jgi:hypothetical protein